MSVNELSFLTNHKSNCYIYRVYINKNTENADLLILDSDTLLKAENKQLHIKYCLIKFTFK